MKKQYRLRSRTAFQKVYREGRSQANRAAVVYLVMTRDSEPAVGVAAGRKLGSAVVRNRVKRRLREAVRKLWDRVKPGSKLVVIGRVGAKELDFAQLVKRLEELMLRVGALSGPRG